MNGITSVVFLIPKEKKEEEHIVEFQLYIPMGYLESVHFFCAAIKTVKDRVNNTMASRQMANGKPLEKLVETAPAGENGDTNQKIFQSDKQRRNLPPRARQVALAHVEVYLYDFIGVVQGSP